LLFSILGSSGVLNNWVTLGQLSFNLVNIGQLSFNLWHGSKYLISSLVVYAKHVWCTFRRDLHVSFKLFVPNPATFLLAVHNIACTNIVEHKACKRIYDYPDAQFAVGMKVMTVKETHRAEQRGPTGIHQPRKTETSLPTRKEDICPFKINIHFNKKDDLFHLSKNGSVHTHSGHVRHTVIFARADQINKNVQKMIKDF
jgi:hypothetical protein